MRLCQTLHPEITQGLLAVAWLGSFGKNVRKRSTVAGVCGAQRNIALEVKTHTCVSTLLGMMVSDTAVEW